MELAFPAAFTKTTVGKYCERKKKTRRERERDREIDTKKTYREVDTQRHRNTDKNSWGKGEGGICLLYLILHKALS